MACVLRAWAIRKNLVRNLKYGPTSNLAGKRYYIIDSKICTHNNVIMEHTFDCNDNINTVPLKSK